MILNPTPKTSMGVKTLRNSKRWRRSKLSFVVKDLRRTRLISQLREQGIISTKMKLVDYLGMGIFVFRQHDRLL
jgi:hypothetical protein